MRLHTMFFASLIASPILAGLVAGVWTPRRLVPWSHRGCCCVRTSRSSTSTSILRSTSSRSKSSFASGCDGHPSQ
jgi:hypothetical protein